MVETSAPQEPAQQGGVGGFLNGLVTSVTDAAAEAGRMLETFGKSAELMRYEGFADFSRTMMERSDALKAAGIIPEGSDPDALIERMRAMAEKDPQVFTKLNDIIKAEGFDGFLQRVSQNENLQRAFRGLLGDSAQTPDQSLAMINALHAKVEEGGFFPMVNDFIDKHPGMANTFADFLVSNPQGAMAALQSLQDNPWLQQLMESFSGLGDGFSNFFQNFDMQGGFEALCHVLLAVVNGVYAMTEGITKFGATAMTSNDWVGDIRRYIESPETIVTGNGGNTRPEGDGVAYDPQGQEIRPPDAAATVADATPAAPQTDPRHVGPT